MQVQNFLTKPRTMIAAGVAALAIAGVGITKTAEFKEPQKEKRLYEMKYFLDRLQRDARLDNGSATTEDKILHYRDVAVDGLEKAKDDILNDPKYWAALAGVGTLALGMGALETKKEDENPENK